MHLHFILLVNSQVVCLELSYQEALLFLDVLQELVFRMKIALKILVLGLNLAVSKLEVLVVGIEDVLL